MEVLLGLTAVSVEHELKGLRRLFNEVEANVRSLKALGVERESYGTMLTSVLLTKLPPEIRLVVTRKAPGDDLDLEILLRFWRKSLLPGNARVTQLEATVTHRTSFDQHLQQ